MVQLRLLSRPETRPGVPCFCHRYYPDDLPPAPSVSKRLLVRVLQPFVLLHCAGSVLFGRLSLTHIAVWRSFAHARSRSPPPSSTSPMPTQASPTTPMLSMARLIMHRYVRILPHFVSIWRICQHWLITILLFSHCALR